MTNMVYQSRYLHSNIFKLILQELLEESEEKNKFTF